MGDKVVQSLEHVSYLSQKEAAEIDEVLMGPLGFSVDQLMVMLSLSLSPSRSFERPFVVILFPNHMQISFQELAGLSVAASIAEVLSQFYWPT